MEKECILCHYGEIGLKGENRRFFERRLVSNIKSVLPGIKVSLLRGRILVFGKKREVEERLKRVFGIVSFSFARIVPSLKEEIKREVISLLKEESFNSFRVTVKRADKSFPISSVDFSSYLGAEIKKETKKEVSLQNYDLNCIVEITKKESYIYFKKIKGQGGLPVGTGGKAVSLISGGIDSPVSSFFMSRRGMKNIFVHFHAYPSTSRQSIEKVERIVKKLSLFQGKSKVYLFSFDKIQKEILLNTKESLRVLLYRRAMMKIAESIAKREGARALITGESLGQVSSQTVENISVTNEAVKLPVFRPLIGFDKEDIIKKAKEIETYDISILPEDDCCIRFLPKNPATKADIKEILEEESKFSLDIKKEDLQTLYIEP